MRTEKDQHFDVIVEALEDSIVRDAREIERWKARGRKANAQMIKNIREDAARKLAAVEFVKQQGWICEVDFPSRQHHWEGIIAPLSQ